MTTPDEDDFSPIDLDDDLVRQAILETQGREYTDEEIEELALEAAEQSEEFKELEARQAQGLWNYPFEGADVFLAVDEDGNEIIPTDLDVIKYLCSNIVRRELSFFEIDKLDKPITRSELAIVVYAKVRACFPNYEIGRERLKTLLDALTNNPTAEPGMTIPVWNGRTVSKPNGYCVPLDTEVVHHPVRTDRGPRALHSNPGWSSLCTLHKQADLCPLLRGHQ